MEDYATFNRAQRRFVEKEVTARVKVENLNPPQLQKLDFQSVKFFKHLYKQYEEKISQMGGFGSRPMRMGQCIHVNLEDQISEQLGKLPDEELTNEEKEAVIEEAFIEGTRRLKEKKKVNVFAGLKFRVPRSDDHLMHNLQEFKQSITHCISQSGLKGVLNDPDERVMRKQLFPVILEAVWPTGARKTLMINWQMEGQSWLLKDLLKNIETEVISAGGYKIKEEEDKIESTRSLPRSKSVFNTPQSHPASDSGVKVQSTFSKTSRVVSGGVKPRSEIVDRNGGDTKVSKNVVIQPWQRNLTCFNCGEKGHAQRACTKSQQAPETVKRRRLEIGKERIRRLAKVLGVPNEPEEPFV